MEGGWGRAKRDSLRTPSARLSDSPSRLGRLLLESAERIPHRPLPPPHAPAQASDSSPGHVGPLRGARPRPRGSLTSSVHRAVGSASRCKDSRLRGVFRGLRSWSGGHVPDTGATQSPCLKVVGALGRGISPSLNRGPALHRLGGLEHVT